jgi:hypothetical protein
MMFVITGISIRQCSTDLPTGGLCLGISPDLGLILTVMGRGVGIEESART